MQIFVMVGAFYHNNKHNSVMHSDTNGLELPLHWSICQRREKVDPSGVTTNHQSHQDQRPAETATAELGQKRIVSWNVDPLIMLGMFLSDYAQYFLFGSKMSSDVCCWFRAAKVFWIVVQLEQYLSSKGDVPLEFVCKVLPKMRWSTCIPVGRYFSVSTSTVFLWLCINCKCWKSCAAPIVGPLRLWQPALTWGVSSGSMSWQCTWKSLCRFQDSQLEVQTTVNYLDSSLVTHSQLTKGIVAAMSPAMRRDSLVLLEQISLLQNVKKDLTNVPIVFAFHPGCVG